MCSDTADMGRAHCLRGFSNLKHALIQMLSTRHLTADVPRQHVKGRSASRKGHREMAGLERVRMQRESSKSAFTMHEIVILSAGMIH